MIQRKDRLSSLFPEIPDDDVTLLSESEENFAVLASKRLGEASQKTQQAEKMKNKAKMASEYERFDEMVEHRKRMCGVEQKVCFALIGVFAAIVVIGIVVLTCLYLL